MATPAHLPTFDPHKVFIVAGPSGVGKDTIVQALHEKNPSFYIAVSYTTRPMRPGEVDGQNYYYISRERFDEMRAEGAFLESAEYAENLYGTPCSEIRDDVITVLVIELRGAQQIKEMYPEIPLIFILPPHLDALRQRILKRSALPPEGIEKRMRRAEEEIKIGSEIADFLILNKEGSDGLARAVKQLGHILSL